MLSYLKKITTLLETMDGVKFYAAEIIDKNGNNVDISENGLSELQASIIDYICPTPSKWTAIHKKLYDVWKKNSYEEDQKPPVPLLLSTWNEKSTAEKAERWWKTVKWAEENNCEEQIEIVNEEDKYKG